MILFNIADICKATGKNRLEIYALLNKGAMNYLITKDGKRKIEQQELFRIFPTADLEKLKPNMPKKLFQPKDEISQKIEQKHNLSYTKEMQDLRGMINDLKKQIDNVLLDNRRLLCLLDYQVRQKDDSNFTQKIKPVSTDMAKQGWQQYQKMRKQFEDTDDQPMSEVTTNKLSEKPMISDTKTTKTIIKAAKTTKTVPNNCDNPRSFGATIKHIFLKN